MKRVRRFFVKLLRRFRYSGGHGIHSPFAFDFVSNIVYNPCPYYFFDASPQASRNSGRILSYPAERKAGKLLFRIVERYKLSSIIVVGGQHPTLSIYCVAPSPAIKLYAVETVNLGAGEAGNDFLGQPSLILFDDDKTKKEWMELYEKVKPALNGSSVLVVPALHDDPEKKVLWHELCNDPFVHVTFDLYDIGILFFNKKLHKKNYIVSH